MDKTWTEIYCELEDKSRVSMYEGGGGVLVCVGVWRCVGACVHECERMRTGYPNEEVKDATRRGLYLRVRVYVRVRLCVCVRGRVRAYVYLCECMQEGGGCMSECIGMRACGVYTCIR